MKATIVGLVTPHLLKILDLAKQADTGTNVDWHVKDAVAKAVDDLGPLYNAQELLEALAGGLESAAQEAGKGRLAYANVLRSAVTLVKQQAPRPAF